MKKIEFKNLPDKTTPINSTNLNKIQDNIEDVFDGKEAMGSIVVDDITCKNLLKFTAYSQTKNGITVTVNEDKTVHISGTATATTNIALGGGFSDLTLDAGAHTLSIGNSTPSGVYINAYYSSATLLTQIAPTTKQKTFNVAETTTYTNFRTECYINNGVTIDMTIKPMLEKGSVATEYVEHKEYDNSKIIKNEKTSSKIDTYSCTYINDLIFKPLRDVTDMNNIKTSGIFTLNANTNVPAGTAYYNVAVFYYDTNPNYAYMIATKLDDPNIYVRYKFETWKEWKKIVPTAI